MAHQAVPEAAVAQAAATLAAGALRTTENGEMPEAVKIGDYALEVFWHIYEAMRIGVETAVEVPVIEPPRVNA
jgi:hypothetical protein